MSNFTHFNHPPTGSSIDDRHEGKMVASIIKQLGMKHNSIARRMGMSRNTLNERLKSKKLPVEFVVQAAQILNYYFINEFPEYEEEIRVALDNPSLYQTNKALADAYKLERKYTLLLERYNALLQFLIRVANNNKLGSLKAEIDQFLADTT